MSTYPVRFSTVAFDNSTKIKEKVARRSEQTFHIFFMILLLQRHVSRYVGWLLGCCRRVQIPHSQHVEKRK